MPKERHTPRSGSPPSRVNPGYARLQLSRALTAAAGHTDPEVRARARDRIERWSRVLGNIVDGSVDYGSRTPVEDFPAWVTLEVVTGGFATGRAVAGGPLEDDEIALLDQLPPQARKAERLALNHYFLSEEGQRRLLRWLDAGAFRIETPEEGALVVTAALLERGEADAALDLIDTIEPFFDRLRFYPRTSESPRISEATVHVRSIGDVIDDLHGMEPPADLLRQRENVTVWAPFLDRLAQHFLDTFEDEWPLRATPDGWAGRGRRLEAEYRELRRRHPLCRKPERTSGHYAQLLAFLRRCNASPDRLDGREVGRLRLIIQRHVEKWGEPGSKKCTEARGRQQADVEDALYSHLAGIVAERLQALPADSGLSEPATVLSPVSDEEAQRFGVAPDASMPAPVVRRVERCREDTVDALVERGLITSGDMLAALLPQITSTIHARTLADPRLARIYEAVYRAFRRRRSLLLLDLESQVRIAELPWVSALERFRHETPDAREAAHTALRDVVLLQLTWFPHAIVPNALLREVRALAKASGEDIPLVEELAADIFMGRFAPKFSRSARLARTLLEGALYEAYYGIRGAEGWPTTEPDERRPVGFWRRLLSPPVESDRAFDHLCHVRAGVEPGGWDVVANGMVIEQQQILTTQNLAALYVGLDLAPSLEDRLTGMAEGCFRWILRRQQQKVDDGHARRLMVKNTAYAWRQMIFYLSLVDEQRQERFVTWGTDLLHDQAEAFRVRFTPAWKGLLLALHGTTPPSEPRDPGDARQFLGWHRGRHWVLGESG